MMNRAKDENQDPPRNWHVAVVGSGPSGLYATEALVRRGARVDVFERQFAPFGLVRYGVAPDHEKIKKTQLLFERTLQRPEVRWFGGVDVGVDVGVTELLELYDQVLIAGGCSGARPLDIPGEDLPNSVSATEFVNWYNGHPDFVDRAPRLDTDRAVIVGMGNVAIDVARILIRDPAALARTDISPRALVALEESQIRSVVLLARRGPNQAAFEEKEVRELAALPNVEVLVDGYVARRKTRKSEFIASFRRVEAPSTAAEKTVVMRFCASPRAVLGKDRVEAVRIERNDLVESAARMKAVGTGEYTTISCGLLVRAIGYHGVAIEGVPFCEATGTVPNRCGRVLDRQDGEVVARMYVTGWAKRGPTGLIGTNKSCANETVAKMEEDLNQVGPLRSEEAIVALLAKQRVFDKGDWARLDRWEQTEGARLGRVRSKVLSRQQALDILNVVD